MKAIFRRELRSHFTGMYGYLTAAFLLLFAGVFTMAICLKNGYASFEYVLSDMTFIFMLLVPMLTMRSIAEERRQKTDALLYSLPVSMWDVTLGKYFSLLVVLAAPTLVICLYPPILMAYGTVDTGMAYSSVLAFLLLGATLTAVGMFVSSLTENQIAAAVLTFALLLLNYYLTALSSFVSSSAAVSYVAVCVLALLAAGVLWLMTGNAPMALIAAAALELAALVVFLINKSLFVGLAADIMTALCVFDRFDAFTSGVFDITAVVYFITVSFVFLFLTVQSLEKRRWS